MLRIFVASVQKNYEWNPFCIYQHSYVDARKSWQSVLLSRFNYGLDFFYSNDAPFNFGIQTEWQVEMMAKFGHNYAFLIDATVETTQIQV